jgi:hypothetical protein
MKRMMILLSGAMLSFCAHAADKGATQKSPTDKTTEWTKEQRETMAKNHDAMAACLRSDKSINECHDEMMKNCQSSDTCPMKGRMGMHHGMMNNGK